MKKIKILILMSSILIVYFIYNNLNNRNIVYMSMGDGLSLGINSYGAVDYGYSDYFKDYLKKKNLLNIYTKDFSRKEMTIKDLYNYLLLDKKININNNVYSIKNLLRESDILTISIGLNDLIYKYTLLENKTDNNENKIIKEIIEDYDILYKEIKKYYKNKIYLIGYYEKYNNYNNLIKKLNREYKNYCFDNDDIYIDISNINNESFFDNEKSYYPNIYGYKYISSKIKDKYISEN